MRSLKPSSKPQQGAPDRARSRPPSALPTLLQPADSRDAAGGGGGFKKTGGAAEREGFLLGLERQGDIRFEALANDGTLASLEKLLALKNIFSKQLPNMPKDYIVKLIFDPKHKSLVLVSHGAVIGGLTYRPFYPRHFGEVVFLAISANEQVRGYGTRLMNHVKDYCKDHEKITHFLTYADNNAVGYFAKQGFTKEITLAREVWFGFIKDYDGGTLMECVLHPNIPYTKFPEMISAQRAFLDKQVRRVSNYHIVHPGLQFADPPRPVPVKDIAGVVDAGWTEAEAPYRLVTPAGVVQPTAGALQTFMENTLKSVIENPDSWPFREPVDGKEVPDYYDVIKDPVDLTLIQERLDRKAYYIQLEMFAADFKRMFNNCRLYNAPETIYAKCANRLESFYEHKLIAGIAMNSREVK